MVKKTRKVSVRLFSGPKGNEGLVGFLFISFCSHFFLEMTTLFSAPVIDDLNLIKYVWRTFTPLLYMRDYSIRPSSKHQEKSFPLSTELCFSFLPDLFPQKTRFGLPHFADHLLQKMLWPNSWHSCYVYEEK